MKKITIVLLVIMAATLLASCLPEEPQDVLSYCKDQYQTLLAGDPNYPQAFIGACVSSFQTGKPIAYVSMCGYEPFYEEINEYIGEPTIFNKKDCIQYILNYES